MFYTFYIRERITERYAPDTPTIVVGRAVRARRHGSFRAVKFGSEPQQPSQFTYENIPQTEGPSLYL